MQRYEQAGFCGESTLIRHGFNLSPSSGADEGVPFLNGMCGIERQIGILQRVKAMIIFITGASHTGKTALAQKLLEKYKYPYLSIDHLKMGLIRSKNTELTPMSEDGALTEYLWPIVCEMVKTAIENNQNLIVEGCYIPFDWQKDFNSEDLQHIRYFCLVMSEEYIKNNFVNIKEYANIIENRLDDEACTIDSVLQDNAEFRELAMKHKVNYLLIHDRYEIDIEL